MGNMLKECLMEAPCNVGCNERRDREGGTCRGSCMKELLSSISESSRGTVHPLVTHRLVGCIDGEKATHERINYKASVWTVHADMRGQLTAQYTVNMPTNITMHGGWARLLTATIANWTSIINCHVKCMCRAMSTHGIRV